MSKRESFSEFKDEFIIKPPTKGSSALCRSPSVPAVCCTSFDIYPEKELSSVQFSRSVVSDSLQPHELQHAKPPCPSPTLSVIDP